MKQLRAFDYVCVVMALFFVYCCVVQYNDPDPYLWVPIYGAALAISAGRIAKGAFKIPALIVAAGALVYMAAYVVEAVGGYSSADENPMLGMREETREMIGLAIVGIWALLVAFVPPRVSVESPIRADLK